MQCAACHKELEAFTGDVCPHCQHFAHPTRLGIYHGLELIKRGGMGSVYRARHPELGTVVAIKTVQTHTGPETLAERFEQEAKLAARIDHPGVVRVYDYDCQEGRLYLVMELVEGETLRAWVGNDQVDIAWKLEKIAQLADVLHAAHEKGIVHRDVKPENVMVDGTGRVRVLDFGVSRVIDEGSQLTQTGEILGTPEYISPEQVLDVPEAIDARTDVYATGVVLYELLTGHSPFTGNNLFQILKNVEALDPPPPSQLRPGLPKGADELVMACIAKEKDARPADCRTLARRIRELIPEGEVSQRTPVGLLAAIALVCIAAGFGLARWWPGLAPAEARSNRAAATPAARIQAIVEGKPPLDRIALLEASRQIQDDAPAKQVFWRGMARQRLGSLCLALRDFASAREAGFPRAAPHEAALYYFKHGLFPKLLGETLLGSTLEEKDAPAELPPKWVALADGGANLAEEMASIDRTAPFRYLLEAAIAIRSNDESRLRAALELAQVTGEANFASAIWVAHRLRKPRSFSAAEKSQLRQMAEELTGPHAAVIQKLAQERLQ